MAVADLGEPGGDGGIATFGSGGNVKEWTICRVVVYGEEGADADAKVLIGGAGEGYCVGREERSAGGETGVG